MAGLLTEQQVGPNWWTWWLGDLASLMVLVPLVLAYRQRTWRPLSPARWLELALLFVCVLAAGQFIFGGWLPENSADNLVYLTMILLNLQGRMMEYEAVTSDPSNLPAGARVVVVGVVGGHILDVAPVSAITGVTS
jgi:integral membrane sensor domain MASE1